MATCCSECDEDNWQPVCQSIQQQPKVYLTEIIEASQFGHRYSAASAAPRRDHVLASFLARSVRHSIIHSWRLIVYTLFG